MAAKNLSDDSYVSVGERRVRVTNLDKVLYPSTGTTKGDVIEYYSSIAATMLPHLRGRAVTRKRWPHGVGEKGDATFFFQKDVGDGAPDWVELGEIQHKDHTNAYPLVEDAAGLVWLAQLASLELHVPQWRFGEDRKADLNEPQFPDRMVFDLDPGEGVSLVDCAKVAFIVRDILDGMGLAAIPLTSGSAGIHLYTALDGQWTSDQVSSVAKRLAQELEADHPDEVTSRMKRALRPGKVFIDWSQNNAAKTTVAPYSLRGRARPTVATPRTWRELASPHLTQLEFREVLRRVQRRGDPLAGLYPDSDDDDSGRAEGAADTRDRLVVYRSKRDAQRTPEPVPAENTPPTASGNAAPVFVIQRHDARRLHHDFRLEHDGVLVSWALPKGPPTDPAQNHLAVPTEDHPMEYRHFEGTIPQGEYGGGTVEIWDEGTYEQEKWRDDEIIVTLHGRPDGGLGGTRRFALFRTGERGGKAQWMIHLMEAPSAPAPRSTTDVPFAPMLAENGTFVRGRVPNLSADEWAVEMKWDGIRALAHVTGASCAVRSRSGADITASYPEFAQLSDALHVDDAVLDGEVIAFDDHGTPSFARLQSRFGLTSERDIARARQQTPVTYVIFDVLQINGQDCRSLSYRERRELLEQIVDADETGFLALPEAFSGSVHDAERASRELGLEGLVAKRLTGRYHSGERSDDWIKFPFIHTAEAVIIGWRESTSDAKGFASLLLAEPDRAQINGGQGTALRYAGRVGTGFRAAERRKILGQLTPLRTDDPAVPVPAEIRRDAHWVRPEVVCEVTSKGRTRTGVFRQPVWRGFRPDRTVESLS